MNTIWRFSVDENRQWRWQQLAVDRAVIAESSGSFAGYEACIAGAQKQGYVYEAAMQQPFRGNGKTRSGRRSA